MIIVNVSLTTGVVLASIGAGIAWGPGAGLIVAGMLVLLLTLYKIERTRG